MASATSSTPYGSRPEPKSLDGNEPQRSGNFGVRTDHPTTRPGGPGQPGGTARSCRGAGALDGQALSLAGFFIGPSAVTAPESSSVPLIAAAVRRKAAIR